jgi:hypothetical protein
VAYFSADATKHQRISNLREREVLVDMLWLLTVSQALWAAPPAIMPALRLVPPVMRVYAGGDIVPPMEDSSMVVQGGSRCTWSAEEEWNEQVQIVLSTEGHTLDAEIELWYGPDNSIPCTMRVYSEDGHVRPVSAVIETPGDENTVAIRNIGLSEFPVTADLITEIVDTPLANTRELADSTYDSMTIEGGQLRTYPFEDPSVDSVQVYITTEGLPLNARIEVLQGLDDIPQIIELYTEDGLDRPFFCVINTPGVDNVVRVVNTAAVEYPMTVSVVPHSIGPDFGPQEAYELQGGYAEMDEGGWGSVRDRTLAARRFQGPQVYGRGFRAERSAEARRMQSELHGPVGMYPPGYGPPLVDGGYGEDPSGWGTPWGGVREAALRTRQQPGGVGHYGGGFRAARSAQNRQLSRWHDVGEQGGPYGQYMGYGGYNSGLGFPRGREHYGVPGNYGGPHSVKEGGRVPFGYRARNNAENRRAQRYGDY